MTDLSIITDTASWQSGFERRIRAWYGSVGFSEAMVERKADRIRESLTRWTIAEITSAGDRVGHVAVHVGERDGSLDGRIGDLWVEPAHTGRGHEQAARAWAERWCAERGVRQVAVGITEPAGVFADYPVRAQTRMRVITSPAESVDGVVARPLTEEEYPAWRAAEHAGYAADIARSGYRTAEEARRKADRDFAELLPQGLATPDHTFLALEAAGEVIGSLWLNHGFLPGATFIYSLEVHEKHRGKGYGRAMMAAAEQATLAVGDTALMLNVFGGNEIAMRLYTGTGYRVVDESRSIELPGA